MKIGFHSLVVCLLLPLPMVSQSTENPPKPITPSESGAMWLTSDTLLGTVRQISVTVMRKRNLNTGLSNCYTRLSFHDKNRYSADASTDFYDTLSIAEVLRAMSAISNSITANIKGEQISFKTSSGVEAGAFYKKLSPAEVAGGTRTEKVYVTTEAKQFEGKTVYEDAKGKFIWKTVVPDATGTWVSYFQVEDHVLTSKVTLLASEFKHLSELVAQSKTIFSN